MKIKAKDLVVYGIILILLIVAMFQWFSLNNADKEIENRANFMKQLQFLLGIGDINSAHQHADVKVYINGKAMDFSQPKYQLTTNYIHFEEGIGDVIHTHAAGLTVGHMIEAVGGTLTSECIQFDSESYCNDKNYKLKMYVNGQPNNEFDNHIIEDLDKILISYGVETPTQIQTQIAAITDMAKKFSGKE